MAGREGEPNETHGMPQLVYFWGPVRAHVNRVALEYAQRLNPAPVWLEVPDGIGTAELTAGSAGSERIRSFVLGPGEDVDRVPTATPSTTVEPGAALPNEIAQYVQYPAAARQALEAVAQQSEPRVLVLTNLDRLGHVEQLTEPGLSRSLLQALGRRGVIVVITTEKLLKGGGVPMECAFRVDSAPGDEWWDSELYPGVPVSCCSSCSGSPGGGYAECSQALRSVCPVRLPFSPGATAVEG